MTLREKYPKGAKFKVVRKGAYLIWMKPFDPGVRSTPGGFRRVRHDLRVGDVIECAGCGPGWGSDPGYGVLWLMPGGGWSSSFRPRAGGIWDSQPADGYLERVRST